MQLKVKYYNTCMTFQIRAQNVENYMLVVVVVKGLQYIYMFMFIYGVEGWWLFVMVRGCRI